MNKLTLVYTFSNPTYDENLDDFLTLINFFIKRYVDSDPDLVYLAIHELAINCFTAMKTQYLSKCFDLSFSIDISNTFFTICIADRAGGINPVLFDKITNESFETKAYLKTERGRGLKLVKEIMDVFIIETIDDVTYFTIKKGR